jgi:hypothetical protein
MSHVDALWQDLLTSAILGTERRPPSLPSSRNLLGAILGQLDQSAPQHVVLQGAAALNLYRKAGRLPATFPANAVSPCAADEQARVSPAAAVQLATLLGGENKELIPEWLGLAAAASQRAPEELLPDLVDWGENNLDQLDLLLPVLGKRGRWLAKQLPWGENVAAAVLVETIPTESAGSVWQNERKMVRLLLLRRQRRTNPALARQLVASTWSEESAETRKTFLEAFKDGLSMGDEAFLEERLDDRSREVRSAAAGLLGQLAESSLVQRQVKRAQACLKWQPGGFLRKPLIEVTLPETCDKGMLRDGVEPKPPIKNGLGQKGEWLLQILKTIPPAVWNRQWGKKPSELLEIAANGEWQTLLHEGWITATLQHPDPDWAEAILNIYPKRGALLMVLPLKRRLAYLTSHIQADPQKGIELLLDYEEPWGPVLTNLALPYLAGYFLNDDPARFYSIKPALLAFGQRMDPSLTGEVTRQLLDKAVSGSSWEKNVETLLKILDFRQRMLEEIL